MFKGNVQQKPSSNLLPMLMLANAVFHLRTVIPVTPSRFPHHVG